MMLMSKILGILIIIADAYSTISIRLNSILTSSSNQGSPILQPEKLEIDLQDKANNCYHLPAMVKVILYFW